MPNHVGNKLEIYGDREIRDALVLAIKDEDSEFSFEKLIPPPDDPVYPLELPMDDPRIKMPNNWYNWNREHWGTKWGAYEVRVGHNSFVTIIYFDTAWSIPEPIIQKLTEMFPTLKFVHKFFDEGHFFWGTSFWEAGTQQEGSYYIKGEDWKTWEDYIVNETFRRLCIETKDYDPLFEYED